MKKAIIETATGLVLNIIEIKSGAAYDPGPGRELRNAGKARTGGTWNGTAYIAPPAREPKPDPQAELDAAIGAATTIDELKAALLGQASAGRVAGRPA